MMEKNAPPNQPRLVGIAGGFKVGPFADTDGLDLDGSLVHRPDGTFDSRASGKKLLRSMHKGPIDRLSHYISWWIHSTNTSGFVRTSMLIGKCYDILCARVRGFDEAYYQIVRAKTPLDWARIRRMPVVVFTTRLGYSLEDKPSFIARTIKRRHKLELPPEIRELVDLVRNEGRPSTTR